MCGICASIGKENEVQDVVLGLKKLEYRGYDSSGIALLGDGKISCVKSVGQIKNLEKKIDKNLCCPVVIGHTRWATHGVVSEENAHPHISQDGQFAMVHNGIIENFEKLKTQLDVCLYSQTDTEVFVNLIASKTGETLFRLLQAAKEVVGSFAVALIHKNENKIFVAKRQSPLAVAVSKTKAMAASDISVFAGKFDFCYILDDNQFAVMEDGKVDFFDENGKKIQKNPVFIGDFDFFEETLQEKYFMQKEIKEQPVALRKEFFKYFSECPNLNFEALKKCKSLHFVACGTAYHSCLLGAQFVQQFCKKPCSVSIASEFRYARQTFSKKCLYVFVSQSGETADTIACAKLVKQKGCKVMCVTNVPYCTLEQMSDFVFPTFAGKEIAVASTKAYTCQVFALLCFALLLSGVDKKESLKNFVKEFEVLPFQEKLLKEICKFKKVFFIGRQQDYVTALEGSLKLKEIAYLNCIGIAAGELKHGTLALIDNQTLVIAISTQERLKEKMESNILEVKARGGKVLLLSNLQHNFTPEFRIDLPDFEECFMPIVSIVPLQQLAFFYSLALGFNPDKPRNLAKAVTVE